MRRRITFLSSLQAQNLYFNHQFRFLSIPIEPSSLIEHVPKTLKSQKRIHVETSSESVRRDIYRCNLRISSLGRRGDIAGARALFDQMHHRDVVTYAAMINFYLKNDDLPQAESLFKRIPGRNVVAESSMIDGLAKAGRIDEARRLFDKMEVRNVFTWTILLSGYCLAGQVENARKVFDKMPEKNVISWTTMVLGYARNGFLSDARIMFDQMPARNTVAWTAMIKAYVEEDRIEEAGKLFEEMPQPNLYSWNIMIKGYLNCRRVDRAISFFNSMPERNPITWTTMVSGLADNGMIEDAQKLFDQMPTRDIASWNAIITAYSSNSQMDMAQNLFESMPERNIMSWNAMIDGYAKNGSHHEALFILILMLRSSVEPTEFSLTSLLAKCDSLAIGMNMHDLAIKLSFVFDTCLSNALVIMYSRNGELSDSWLAFTELKAKDFVSWSSMILAFANHGCGLHALEAFAKMLRCGTQPDSVTFIGLLSACSHAGLVEKGRRIFDSMMRGYGVEPKAEHYCCLIDILRRADRVDEASLVLSRVPECERDSAVLGTIVGAACKAHGGIVEDLIELEPLGSGAFVSLANGYASMGRWSDAARVRKMMRERKVEKVAGFSQIDLGFRGSHVFFSADRAHSQQEEIYEMLQESLLPQMKDMLCCRQVLFSS
ncbi:pentatricopeptide repeat-containing protein At4g02750-like [Phalaenopsis equestris]|uniref:pentatricopeptide repeat-containing protein At4g02750-like n=1 Tax=Phalaenopsis equestris TaxID=78828 RepID=UPI0009E60470|nr:pentatricopeptide repeat-containing protein At4g02750-like [Phalaenopsis equestris]